MHTTRLQLNSAALWWFLNRLTAKERAEVLGEYVKVLALGARPSAAGGGRRAPPRTRRRKTNVL
jgi:hypothetical protein